MTRPADLLSTLVPPPASDAAAGVDGDLFVLLASSGLVLLIVAGLLVWFGVRYRATRPHRPHVGTLPSRRIEIGWASALVVFSVAFFGLGASTLLIPHDRPRSGEPVYVVGKQWMWKVQHPDGRREINELHLPAGEPVRILLTSQDVIHSLYIPAFRVKQDAVPGRFTTLSILPTRPGEYRLLCAEYCGANHSRMLGRVVVMRPSEYARWLESGDAEAAEPRQFLDMAGKGAELFTRFGCGACHTRTSTPQAPRLDGIFGRQSRMQTGEIVVVNEGYIRQSLLEPGARIVAGYGPGTSMPSYQGQMTAEQINTMVEFIRSLRDGWPDDGEPAP